MLCNAYFGGFATWHDVVGIYCYPIVCKDRSVYLCILDVLLCVSDRGFQWAQFQHAV